ncbi:hypothetical protein IGX34_04620 [Dyella sp. 7MK23]|uniref:Uncharacterized protein n=1 Tax=Dyella acidiphila TaxID=2775866 RepID=A0ABR9G6I4_9GAMM|nr:hypothetical protein [Dyella acidiphila]
MGLVLFSAPALAVTFGDHWDLGGAVRVRVDDESRRDVHKVGLDTVMLSARYTSDSWIGAARYRFYGAEYPYQYVPHFGDIRFMEYAWIGYRFDSRRQLQLGLNQVPFGLQPLYSSTFWETLGNVVGMEDVSMLGGKYIQDAGDWNIQAGYYARQAWPGHGTSRGSTYSVVVTPADPGVVGGTHNVERDLFVGRLTHKTRLGGWTGEAGLSLLTSGLYNYDTRRYGRRNAYAVHYAASKNGWSTKLQYARQQMAPRNPDGEQTISVGGYDGTFNLATRGNFYAGDLSYRFGDSYLGGWIKDLSFYSSYSMYEKSNPAFRDSQRFILGTSFSVKFLSVYLEWLNGRNDPYIGGGSYAQSLAAGGIDRWRGKFYLNVGYYF